MTYDEYVLKVRANISRLQAAWKWVKKNRVPIISGLIAVAAVVLLLMYFSGTFTSALKVSDSVYGEPLDTAAKAFLSHVEYNYGDENGAVPYVPYRAGSYTVSARTENPFGTVREQESSFVISRRRAVITLKPFNVYYGDRPVVSEVVEAEGLAEGDRIDSADIVYDELLKRDVARIVSVTVRSSGGEDVTDCYDLTLGSANVRIMQRPITVATASAEKKYDGKPLTDNGYTIKSGSLAAGDEIVMTFHASVERPGTVINTADIKILHGDEDRTDLYSVTQSFGALTVLPLRINVKTGSAEKVYDGKPLSCREYELDDAELLPGHVITPTLYPELTSAGVIANKIEFKVNNESGEYFTDCYEFVFDAGTLVVKKRLLTVKSGSALGEYGEPVSCCEAEIVSGDVVGGQKIYFDNFKEYINAGTYKNTFTVAVCAGDGSAVTGNYDITYEYGSITITRKPIGVKVRIGGVPGVSTGFLASAEPDRPLAYNDSQTYRAVIPLSVTNELIESYFIKYYYIYREKTTLNYCYDISFDFEYDSDIIDRIRAEAPPYVPGDDPGYDPGVDPGVGPGVGPGEDPGEDPGFYPGEDPYFDPGAAEEYGPSGIGSYGINGGTGTSSQIPSSAPTPGSDPVGFIMTGRPGGVYLRLRSYGDYTGDGWAESPIYDMASKMYPHPLDFVCYRLMYNGFDKYERIVVSYEPDDGLFPVPYYSHSESYKNKKYIYTDVALPRQEYQKTLAFNSIPQPDLHTMLGLNIDDEIFYDDDYYDFVKDKYLSLPETTEAGIREIISKAGLDPSSPTIISDVAEYVRNAALYNGNFKPFPENEDRVLYFLNEAKEGICSHFASAAVAIYRALGIPARYTVGYYALSDGTNEQNEYYEKDAHAWAEVYVKRIGWIPVEVTSSNVAAEGSNSDLQPPRIDAMMFFNRVVFSMKSAAKDYDGEYLYSSGPEILPGSNLKEGHTLYAKSGGIKYVGTIPANSVEYKILDEDGNDVSGLYEILERKNHTLTVNTLFCELPKKTLYVGETVKLPASEEIPDEKTAALVGNDRLVFKMTPNTSLRLNDDGTITGVIASSDWTVSSVFDMGSIAETNFVKDGGPEVVVQMRVNIVPFPNVRLHSGETPPDGEPGTVKRVTGENGLIYNYLAIKSASVSKKFDGLYLTADDWEIADGGLANGHYVECKNSASQLFVGSCENVFASLCIRDKNGADVTNEYIVDFYPGTLEVTTGEYTLEENSTEVRVDEVLDLRTLSWEKHVADLPVRYVDGKNSSLIRIQDFDLIGISAGRSEITAMIDGVDLNGDGVEEYGPAVRTLGVRVLPAKKSESSALYTGLVLSLAAAAAAVTYLIATASRSKEKE